MSLLKGSAAVLVILLVIVANFKDVALPSGGTVGSAVFGIKPEAPPPIPPIRPKPKVKPVQSGPGAQDAKSAPTNS